MSFEEANKQFHPIENEWHYKMMTTAGFKCESKGEIGFVRHYTYTHDNGNVIKCCTGARADYWNFGKQAGGYWGTLEPFLKSL